MEKHETNAEALLVLSRFMIFLGNWVITKIKYKKMVWFEGLRVRIASKLAEYLKGVLQIWAYLYIVKIDLYHLCL